MQQALRSLSGYVRGAAGPDLAYTARPVREAIRATALELFAKEGFHAVSVRKLAACVGMQPGSLYGYFPTKHDVLAELIEEYEDCLTLSIKQALDTSDGQQDLQKYVHASLCFRVKNPDGATLAMHDSRFLTEGLTEGIESARSTRRRMLASILQKSLGSRCEDFTFLAAGIESVILIAGQDFTAHEQDSFDQLLNRTICLIQNMSGLSLKRSHVKPQQTLSKQK